MQVHNIQPKFNNSNPNFGKIVDIKFLNEFKPAFYDSHFEIFEKIGDNQAIRNFAKDNDLTLIFDNSYNTLNTNKLTIQFKQAYNSIEKFFIKLFNIKIKNYQISFDNIDKVLKEKALTDALILTKLGKNKIPAEKIEGYDNGKYLGMLWDNEKLQNRDVLKTKKLKEELLNRD